MQQNLPKRHVYTLVKTGSNIRISCFSPEGSFFVPLENVLSALQDIKPTLKHLTSASILIIIRIS
jgi:hypothetical protein